MEYIARVLKETRIEKELTLHDVARDIDMPQATIYAIESGRHNDIRLKVLMKLVRYYQLDINSLLTGAGL
jgi:cytoskeletal protein RodZ